MALSDASPQHREVFKKPRQTLSRDTIKDRASIHDRPKTIESRGEAGHREGADPHHLQMHPVALSCMSVSHGSCSPRGSQGKPPQKTISAMLGGVRLNRSSSVEIDHFRQRHRLRRVWPAQDHADPRTWFCDADASRAERRHRKRQWTLASMAAGATCRSTANLMRTSRRSSSRRTSLRLNASGFKMSFQASLPSLERTFKLLLFKRDTLRLGIRRSRDRDEDEQVTLASSGEIARSLPGAPAASPPYARLEHQAG